MVRSRRRTPRRGTVAVWVVVSLAVILGVTAIAMDGGRMTDERQRVRAGADAAALAAAADMYQNYLANKGGDPTGTAAAAAKKAAAANGYANDGTTSVVTVNIPPQSGQYAGQADYVEVVIQSNIDPGFSRVFSGGQLSIGARAVARGRPRKIGIVALSPTGANTLQTSNSGSVRVVNASIIVNSGDPDAYTNTSGDTVTADSIDITGGYQNSGKGLSGTIRTGVAPTPDPLRTFPPPNLADYVVRSSSSLNVNGGTLQPGIYTGGINIRGGGTVTLAPGVYIINGGGLSLGGSSTLTGTGVMIYNTGGALAGSIDTTGNSTLTLTPPTSGTYAGISIFQDRAVTAPVIVAGNSSLQVGGTVYAPAAAVTVTGSGSVTPYAPGGGFIASTVSVSGNGSFVVDPGSNRPKAPDVRLVD